MQFTKHLARAIPRTCRGTQTTPTFRIHGTRSSYVGVTTVLLLMQVYSLSVPPQAIVPAATRSVRCSLSSMHIEGIESIQGSIQSVKNIHIL